MGFHFAVRTLAVLVTIVVTAAALNGCGKETRGYPYPVDGPG